LKEERDRLKNSYIFSLSNIAQNQSFVQKEIGLKYKPLKSGGIS